MKKLQQLTFAILILAAFSSVTFASQFTYLKFFGFSENGKYLAFEELASTGGNHGQFYTTYFVDTAKNAFAIAPVTPADREFTNEYNLRLDQLRYKQSVAKNLKRFGIQSGNLGQFVVAHLLSDFSFMKRTERENFFFEKDKTDPINKMMPEYTGGFVLQNSADTEKVVFNDLFDPYNPTTDEFFELTLIPSRAKAVEGCSDGYKFELTLLNNTGHREPKLQILQKDGDILPQIRNCPFRYRIEQVYVYGDRIAVFLNVFTSEDALPNMNYMVVTGVITDR